MAAQFDSGFGAFPAGEALAKYRCVRLNSSGALVYSDPEEEILGVTQHACASGEHCTIKFFGASPGTFLVETGASITFAVSTDERGTPLYVGNDGKVSGTGTNQKFCALEGAASGQYIHCFVPVNKVNA